MNHTDLINHIKAAALQSRRRNITGRNELTANLFTYLCKTSDMHVDLLLLCTKQGLILFCSASGMRGNISGYTINPEVLSKEDGLALNYILNDYILVSIKKAAVCVRSPATLPKYDRSSCHLRCRKSGKTASS